MKRVREEEGEQKEQAALAPMAASPARNRGLAAAATLSETHHRRVLTSLGQEQETTWGYKAVDFVLSVRREFDRAKYHRFVEVISQIESIGMGGIVERLKVLLRGHPDLKRHFNRFVPADYELSLRDDDQEEEAPAADSLQIEKACPA